MIHWSAHTFYQHLEWIARKRAAAQKAVKEAGRDCQVMGITHHLVTDDRHEIYKCLDHLGHLCSEMQLRATYECCFQLQIKAGNPDAPCYWSDIESGLQGIQWALESELVLLNFAFIPPDKAKYFECDGDKVLFGPIVDEKFPSAAHDIKAAGNCLAADLNTAAIYHLMCVVNIGLLALARFLKLTKIKAVEYQEWTSIIDGLKKKVDALKQTTRSKKKQDDLEFYNGLLIEFSAFKDVYRNNMAHARKHYRFHEAKGVYDRVHDFMQRLATRVSE